MSSALRQFVSEEFWEVWKLFSFLVLLLSFCDNRFTKKDVVISEGDAIEDFIFSQLRSYKFNGFKTVVS